MNVFAEVITIGDEILFGQITDTNTQYICQELAKIGIRTIRKSSVGDNEESILQLLDEASERVDIILMTGGLGPTKDDITKTTLCKFFDTGLVRHEPTYIQVKAFFEKRGKEFTEMNQKQADVPEIAEVMMNTLGTAPGMWIEKEGKIYISMPGVPFEMKKLMQDEVLERLKRKLDLPFIHHRWVHTIGIGESFLADKVKDWENNLPDNMKLAYLPSLGIVRLRLTSYGEEEDILKHEADQQLKMLSELIKPYIFGYESDDKIEAIIGRILTGQQKTLATAESCTGGFLAHLITSIPGSATYYKGTVVSYASEVKVNELGVSAEIIEAKTPVCEEVAIQMAEGVRKKLNTDFALATTGIAGPEGGTEDIPVGTVWIGYADKDKSFGKKFVFGSNRENNIKLAAIYALNMLRTNI